MLPGKRQTLSGWGNTSVEECIAYRPERRRELHLLLAEHPGPLLARGLGRAYGDAALQPGGVVRTERLDRLIGFDEKTGTLRAQAGVTLAEIMALFIPRGWIPPVVPGTRHATLGGMFACNVHGKNHWREGDFGEHVASVRLRLADGSAITCSPSEASDIFWATTGGMGMTGIIEEVALRLKPIASSSLRTLSYCVDSVENMVAAFEHYKNGSDYMVGWIDHMAQGAEIGRGVFEAASHITPDEGGRPLADFRMPKTRVSIPCFAPSLLLNRYSMALYNRIRFRKYSEERKVETVDVSGFFHPLDSIAHWNRLYGRRGFFQYQCLIPDTPDVAERLREFLSLLQRHKAFSFLAVIKYHRDGKGYLTFSRQGYSIALDFPNTRRVRALMPQIDEWVARLDGRVYLAKDATLTPERFSRMYGQAASDWLDLVRDLDPEGHFLSLMSQRLQWKPDA